MDDVAAVSKLRAAATEWLASKGSSQWQQPWPDAATAEARLIASVLAGETWIVEDGKEAVATLALDDLSDPQLWTPEEQVEAARYLHRLVVSRDRAGRGLGARLIDWSCDRAAREAADWVRVDVWTTNQALKAYYTRQGFTAVRTITGTDYPSGALLQRPAVRIDTPELETVP